MHYSRLKKATRIIHFFPAGGSQATTSSIRDSSHVGSSARSHLPPRGAMDINGEESEEVEEEVVLAASEVAVEEVPTIPKRSASSRDSGSGRGAWHATFFSASVAWW